MRRSFLVLGAGGHGRVIADLLLVAGNDVVGFADARPEKLDICFRQRWPMVFDEAALLEFVRRRGLPPDGVDALALGIGDNRARMERLGRFDGGLCPPLVHPFAVVSPSAVLGPGTVVMAGAVVNADARIGAGVIINTGAIVEHDCEVEDGAHLSPRATLAGGVRIGPRAWVGAAATVIQQRTVGEDATVGAGAVVISDVSPRCTVVGVPARPIAARTRASSPLRAASTPAV